MGQRSGMQSIQRYEVHQVSNTLCSLESAIRDNNAISTVLREFALGRGVRGGRRRLAVLDPHLSKFR